MKAGTILGRVFCRSKNIALRPHDRFPWTSGTYRKGGHAMNKKMLHAMTGLFALCLMAGSALALEAKFDYCCDAATSSPCGDFTCVFDASASDGDIYRYDWEFRRYLREDNESQYGTRSGKQVTYTYTLVRCRDYEYYATLTVSDAQGNQNKLTRRIGPSMCEDISVNQDPIADFTITCIYLDCSFDGTASYDPDGEIVDYYWNFGGVGLSADGQTASHTYESPGTYTVLLQVTDNEGAVGRKWITHTVEEYTPPPPPGFNLTAEGYKARGGLQKVDLSWTGTMSDYVNVFRNGDWIVTTPNNGFYTDHINLRGRGTYTHQVCESWTNICSNEVTTVFE